MNEKKNLNPSNYINSNINSGYNNINTKGKNENYSKSFSNENIPKKEKYNNNQFNQNYDNSDSNSKSNDFKIDFNQPISIDHISFNKSNSNNIYKNNNYYNNYPSKNTKSGDKDNSLNINKELQGKNLKKDNLGENTNDYKYLNNPVVFSRSKMNDFNNYVINIVNPVVQGKHKEDLTSQLDLILKNLRTEIVNNTLLLQNLKKLGKDYHLTDNSHNITYDFNVKLNDLTEKLKLENQKNNNSKAINNLVVNTTKIALSIIENKISKNLNNFNSNNTENKNFTSKNTTKCTEEMKLNVTNSINKMINENFHNLTKDLKLQFESVKKNLQKLKKN